MHIIFQDLYMAGDAHRDAFYRVMDAIDDYALVTGTPITAETRGGRVVGVTFDADALPPGTGKWFFALQAIMAIRHSQAKRIGSEAPSNFLGSMRLKVAGKSANCKMGDHDLCHGVFVENGEEVTCLCEKCNHQSAEGRTAGGLNKT